MRIGALFEEAVGVFAGVEVVEAVALAAGEAVAGTDWGVAGTAGFKGVTTGVAGLGLAGVEGDADWAPLPAGVCVSTVSRRPLFPLPRGRPRGLPRTGLPGAVDGVRGVVKEE